MGNSNKKHTVGKVKSERHHWWPECVSEFWKDDDGCVTWILPSGETKRAPPKNFGVIGNGHFIKLDFTGRTSTSWDQNFEPTFQQPDNNFKNIIEWLRDFVPHETVHKRDENNLFVPRTVSDERFSMVIECLVSLAIRSPATRESLVGLAESIRGPLPERERNALIAINMRDMQQMITNDIQGRGKVVIITSNKTEFIFGDGFFHNILSPAGPPMSPKILAPLTPNLTVLFTRPMQYSPADRVFVYNARPEEVKNLNNIVQIYSRRNLFYRSEPPVLTDAYICGRHQQMGGLYNSVDEFIHLIPGVHR